MSSNSQSAHRRRRLARIQPTHPGLQSPMNSFKQQLAESVKRYELQAEPEDSRLYENDLLAWSYHFLPHYFTAPPSTMHREVAAILDAECAKLSPATAPAEP